MSPTLQNRFESTQSLLPPCDPEIKTHGKVVTTLSGDMSPRLIEKAVRKASRLSGCRMDWFSVDNRDVIMTLGNRTVSQQALDRAFATVKS